MQKFCIGNNACAFKQTRQLGQPPRTPPQTTTRQTCIAPSHIKWLAFLGFCFVKTKHTEINDATFTQYTPTDRSNTDIKTERKWSKAHTRLVKHELLLHNYFDCCYPG